MLNTNPMGPSSSSALFFRLSEISLNYLLFYAYFMNVKSFYMNLK